MRIFFLLLCKWRRAGHCIPGESIEKRKHGCAALGKAYDIERSRESNECVISLLIPVSTAGMLHGHRRKKFTSPYNPGLGVMVQCPAAVLTKLVEVKRLTFTPSSEPYQAMVSVVYTLLFRLQ